MAPEIQTGEHSYPVDVLSFGVLMYITLAGYLIEFDNGGPCTRNVRGAYNQGVRFPRNGIDDAHWNLVQRCWRQEPSDRPIYAIN